MTNRELGYDRWASRVFFNILGGSLTLLSVQLPWMTINGMYPISLQSGGGVYAVIMFWALAGALLSFLSRYGGIMTLMSLVGLLGEPYLLYGFSLPGLGVLVAFFGAVLTFAGVRWSIPTGLMKGREVLGGVLYTVGFLIIVTVVVSSSVNRELFSDWSYELVSAAPLLLVAILLTGLGLKLYLKDERGRAVTNMLERSA